VRSPRLRFNETIVSKAPARHKPFDDPVLNEIVEQALSSNPDEKIAIAEIREERAYLAMSRGEFLRSVGLQGSYFCT
jgi:outer membrane protein TolC